MLPQENRLKQKDRLSLKNSKRAQIGFISVTFTSLPQKTEHLNTKFVFIIPSRFVPSATKRNLLRRRVRHIIKKLENKWEKGVYSFYFKKGSEKKTFQDLEIEINTLFKDLSKK